MDQTSIGVKFDPLPIHGEIMILSGLDFKVFPYCGIYKAVLVISNLSEQGNFCHKKVRELALDFEEKKKHLGEREGGRRERERELH